MNKWWFFLLATPFCSDVWVKVVWWMIPQLTQNELMIACQYYIALLDQRTLICFPKGKKTSFLNLEIILFFIRNDCHLRGIIKN